MSPESFDAYRTRMAAIWEPKNLFRVPYAEAMEWGLSELDAQTFDQLGLPSWAAPHIRLHFPTKRSEGRLCIGKDSEGREIICDTNSGRIFVNDADAGQLHIAPSMFDFLALLVELAERIEMGIALHGPDVFTAGRMPQNLMAGFWRDIESRLGTEDAQRSLWRSEVAHMSRNAG